MSDFELLERIRHASPGTPVVVVSELDDPQARAAYERAGAAACLAKPLVVDELRAAVSAQLRRQPFLAEHLAAEAVDDHSVPSKESPAV
jgi:DNA-binding response OmpR family regulator